MEFLDGIQAVSAPHGLVGIRSVRQGLPDTTPTSSPPSNAPTMDRVAIVATNREFARSTPNLLSRL